jgi:hypothetical protein
MNQAFETRSPRTGWRQARANRVVIRQAVEQPLCIESPSVLQAQRLRASLKCTEEVAATLAYLIYGEGRQR